MVIFIATRGGYEEIKPLVLSGLYPVWVGSNVLTEIETKSIRELGVDLTCFSYAISLESKAEVEGALQAISEHHPDHKIWLEWENT